MKGVNVVDHPLVQHKLTLIRQTDTSTKSFRELCREQNILPEATLQKALDPWSMTEPQG